MKNIKEVLFNIIEYFLEMNCQVCGPCIYYILFDDIKDTNNKFTVICKDNDEEMMKQLEKFFELSNRFIKEYTWTQENISKQRKGWVLREDNNIVAQFVILNKLYKYHKKKENNIIISKENMYYSEGSIELLKLLRNVISKKEYSELIKLKLEWIDFFIKSGCFVYGGWLLHFLRGTDIDNDIDIRYPEQFNPTAMFLMLEKSGSCKKIESSGKSYGSKYKLTSQHGDIIFDIHKIEEFSMGDAFVNMLKLNKEGLSITITPKKMTFLKTIAKIFDDIKKDQYTLIKRFPNTINKKSDMRLFIRPFIMEKYGFKINYDYLESIDYKKKLDSYITPDECTQKDHINEEQADFKNVNLKINYKTICLGCLYK